LALKEDGKRYTLNDTYFSQVKGGSMKKEIWLLGGILVLSLICAGCSVRTYPLTRDRVDQDLSLGNRGYLKGTAPQETKSRKTTRTTQVLEIELGHPAEVKKTPKAAALAAPIMEEEPLPQTYASVPVSVEEKPVSAPITFKQYKVEKGDTLQKISQKFYGTTKRWYKIYEANKDILKSPDKLYPGQIINIPLEGGQERPLK